jgi:glycosyltransferase involved in cell wall biosynthesis
MPRLLAICTLPIWPIQDGYSLRVANLLQALAGQWQITLLAPGASPPGLEQHPTNPLFWSDEVARQNKELEIFSDPLRSEKALAAHMPLALVGRGLSYPWRFDNAPLVAAIGDHIATVRPDRALVWPGAEGAWLASRAQVPAVLDMIDCNPLEFVRAALAGHGRVWNLKESATAAVHARRAVRGFGATVCVGGVDAAWMTRLGGRAVHTIPNGVMLPHNSALEDARPTVVFAGTLDYAPNVDAVAFMASDIWPSVRAAVPTARWVIAGRRPVAAIRELDGRDGIAVQADVLDMTAELQSAWVAVAPMRTGVGLKNKVLEAWANARPVVLTPLATNALALPPGHAGLVQAGATGLAAVVTALLCDRTARHRLGQAAQAMVARDFTWAGAGGRFDALLQH